jgi:hypothetical protein
MTSKFNSPEVNRQLKNCLSFANIKHGNQIKTEYEVQTPRTTTTKIQLNTSKKEKENKIHRTISTHNHDNTGIMESYKIQN